MDKREGGVGPTWFRWLAKFLDWHRPATFLSLVGFGWAVFAVIQQILRALGITGSTEWFLLSAGCGIGASLFLVVITHVAKWPLLFLAIKYVVEKKIPLEWFNERTILIGGGAGGALAVGLVSKALQQLGRPVPRLHVTDLDYTGRTLMPDVGTVFCGESESKLRHEDVILVGSFCGTGRSLEVLRRHFGLPDHCRSFIFVLGEDARDPHVSVCILQGRRAVLPWPRSERLGAHRKASPTPPVIEPVPAPQDATAPVLNQL